MRFRKFTILNTLFLILSLATLLNCNKADQDQGNLIWYFESIQFQADLSASAEKRNDLSLSIPTIYINGYASVGNDLQISIYPATNEGTYVSGGPIQTMNSVYANFNGKVYRTDNTINTTSTNIFISELSNERIIGTLSGSLESLSGEVITISASFDLMLQ